MKTSRIILLVVTVAVLFGLFLYMRAANGSRYLDAARAGGGYLVSHMHEDGSFVYEYDPVSGKTSDDYNILRHAGTTYSLFELYEATGDKKYLDAGERALTYLIDHVIPCPNIPEAACVEELGEIKLGGNGLAVLAFAKHAEVTGNKNHLSLAGRLAQWIVGVQSPSGEFTIHKMTVGGGIDDFVSEYYPGEAMFGLAKLSEVTGERAWLDAAHKAAGWMIASREGIATENLPHDHWFLYALNELHKDKPEPTYVDHAKKLTEAIAAAQHQGLTGDKADWNGGYYNPPRSTPTATRNEGLGAAYELFVRAGEAAYAQVAKDAMEHGIAFTLRTQDKNGGFHESLDEYAIRIDYVQHNISALLAFDRILRGK